MEDKMKGCISSISTASILSLEVKKEIHRCDSSNRSWINNLVRNFVCELKIFCLAFGNRLVDPMHGPLSVDKTFCLTSGWDHYPALLKHYSTEGDIGLTFCIVYLPLHAEFLPIHNKVWGGSHCDFSSPIVYATPTALSICGFRYGSHSKWHSWRL